MQTYLASHSPLFTYSPCKACSPASGFQTAETVLGQPASLNGTDEGMITCTTGSVAVNCTGTGIAFDLTFHQGGSTSFTPLLLVNGTSAWSLASSSSSSSPSSSAGAAASMPNTTSILSLPLGQHTYNLTLSSRATDPNANTTDWVRFNGARCVLGQQAGANSVNTTVDDTAWRKWEVLLTPGWNMLEEGSSNWINTTQYGTELLTSSRDYNGSISWTGQADAGNTILFSGSAAWVHGIVGGEAGTYEVVLDNVSQGIFNASGGSRVYDSILYHTSNLADTNHTISLRNVEQGKRLSFDRLVAYARLETAATPSSSSLSGISLSTASPSATARPSAAPDRSNAGRAFGTGAIIGVSVAAVVVLASLLGLGLWAWCRKRRQAQKQNHQLSEKPSGTTFWRWSNSNRPSARSFIPLRSPSSPNHPQNPRSASPFASASSGGTPSRPYLQFPSPTPSIRGKSSTSVDRAAGRPPLQKSFLKFSQRQHAHTHQYTGDGNAAFDEKSQGFLGMIKHARNKSKSTSTIKSQKGAKAKGKGLIISRPTLQEQEREKDIMPSFSDLGHSSTHHPDDDGDGDNLPLPVMSADPRGTRAGQRNTFGNSAREPCEPGQSKMNGEEEDGRHEADDGGHSRARPAMPQRQTSLSPLAAALAGKTASPLAELVSDQRERARGEESYFPHAHDEERPTGHPFGAGAVTAAAAATATGPGMRGRGASISSGLAFGLFGRRRGSLANSLDTRGTFDSQRRDGAYTPSYPYPRDSHADTDVFAFDRDTPETVSRAQGRGEPILSLSDLSGYSVYPPDHLSVIDGDGDEDGNGAAGIPGLALGSPGEDRLSASGGASAHPSTLASSEVMNPATTMRTTGKR